MSEEIIPAQQELIRVVQLPVLSQCIDAKAAEIEAKVKQVLSLAVSPDTLTEVKKVRAELNKESATYHSQFQAVRAAALAPWNEVERKYTTEIRGQYASADKALKEKIDAVTSGIVQECTEKMQAHFAEACAAHDVTWLRWEQCPVKIGLTEAKQKSHKRIMDEINAFAENVGKCAVAISAMENAAEIMAEFKQTLDLPGSVALVEARHQRIAEEERRKQEFEERRKAQIEALRRVEAAVPAPIPAPVPTPVPAPAPVQQEKTCKLNITIHATMPQLKELVEFMKERGIKYEQF